MSKHNSKTGILNGIERHAALLFCNRFLWLVWGIALYLNLHLTYLHWRYQAFLLREWEMWQNLMLIVELGLLFSVLLLVLGIPQSRRAWRKRHPRQSFSYIPHGLASMLVLPVGLAIMLVPLLFAHSFPNEAAAGINIPLMLLQRAFILLLAVSLIYNFSVLLRLYLKLPAFVLGPLIVASQVLLGYWLTLLSFNSPRFAPYNDVFFYNQLWQHFDSFPKLQNSGVFTRISMVSQPGEPLIMGYALFVMFGVLCVLVMMLLWFPRASKLSSLEVQDDLS